MSQSPLDLSRRERQLIEAVYRLEEASVSEIRDAITDAPSYSAVRALLNGLVKKDQLKFRQDGKRYLYRPKRLRESIAKRLLSNLVNNFFRGNASDAICALLDESNLTAEELDAIKQKISQAESEQ